jgi:DNA repair protein RadC
MVVVPTADSIERAPIMGAAPALLAQAVGVAPAVAVGLLGAYGSLGALRRVDASTLRGTHGLTRRQVARLRAALDLATSLLVEPREERPQVTTPRDAARLLLPEMGLLEAEQMRLLLLDTKNRLIAAITLYAGTVSACQVRVAEVFREAVRRNASALIVAHNHPSGVADPSPEDVRITREVVQAGRLLDVDVLDHLIIGADAYTSLRERGLGWE